MIENDVYRELGFYGLYLRRALQRAQKKEADNLGFLVAREKKALAAFNKAKKAGQCIFACRSQAIVALTEGLDLTYKK